MLKKISDIENQIQHGNYKKDCAIKFSIPLYWCKFMFDLTFWSNFTKNAQSLICGFFTNSETNNII